ncbi:Glucose dehydrogenase [FAD, quinone] [Nymphon striatum]|nr:Glucose dehydrogenase [FAD, quinone] [Nymphon striatum]
MRVLLPVESFLSTISSSSTIFKSLNRKMDDEIRPWTPNETLNMIYQSNTIMLVYNLLFYVYRSPNYYHFNRSLNICQKQGQLFTERPRFQSAKTICWRQIGWQDIKKELTIYYIGINPFWLIYFHIYDCYMTSRPERTCFSGLLTLNYLLENSNKIASKRSINSPESKKISGKESFHRLFASNLSSLEVFVPLICFLLGRLKYLGAGGTIKPFHSIYFVKYSLPTPVLDLFYILLPNFSVSDFIKLLKLFPLSSPRLAEIKTKLTRSIYFVSNEHSFHILYLSNPLLTRKFPPCWIRCGFTIKNIRFRYGNICLGKCTFFFGVSKEEGFRGYFWNLLDNRLTTIFRICSSVKGSKMFLGAGSSGAVVASRLSEDPSVTVLLVEAGGEEDLLTKVPLLATVAQFSNKDWNFRTTPQTHSCLGLNGRLTEVNKSSLVFPFSSHKKGRCSPWEASVWPRGKVLGGSSSINRLAYARGSIFDYDLWEKLGAKGWSYKDVLPYFIKSERNISPKYLQKDAHGFKGPMIVQDVPSVSALGKTLLNAAKFLKFVIKDYNDGFGLTQMTSYKGIRQSASRSFLQPIKRRTNLHVITKAFVEKVKINWLKRAEGIIMNRRGRTHFIRAKKEVILSAGAVQTPQILMLSGIGPKDVLRKHNIQIHSQVPGVGRNLQDHLITVTPIFVKSNFALGVFDYVNIPSFLKYLRGTGPIASTPGDVIGYAKTKYSDTGFSDIQIDSIGAAIDNIFFRRSYGIKESIFKSYLNPSPKGFSVSGIITVMLNPRSRGYITIKSSDPYEEPVINPRYLTDPYDVRVMIEGIKMAKKLINTPPYKKIEARVVDNILPPCKKFPLWSEDYLECFIRHLAVTFYHPVGTCKMGSLKDPLTVVDPLLRVRGITGLRIADSSIMPTIPSGNTNAPAIMIGEKAADIIKYTSTICRLCDKHNIKFVTVAYEIYGTPYPLCVHSAFPLLLSRLAIVGWLLYLPTAFGYCSFILVP